MAITNEEKLLLQREQILDELGSMSVRARALVMEFRVLDRKILLHSKDGTGQSFEYAKFRLAVDAIVAYLTKRGTPAEVEDMARSIAAGGWFSADERAMMKLRDSVRYHCRTAKGLEKQVLRQVPRKEAGLVGLYSWPESRFRL